MNFLEGFGVVSSIISIILFLIAIRSTTIIPDSAILYENNLTRTTFLSIRYLSYFLIIILGVLLSIPFGLSFFPQATESTAFHTIYVLLTVFYVLYFLKILFFSTPKSPTKIISSLLYEILLMSFYMACSDLVGKKTLGMIITIICGLIYAGSYVIAQQKNTSKFKRLIKAFDKNQETKRLAYAISTLCLVVLFSLLVGSSIMFRVIADIESNQVIYVLFAITCLFYSISEITKLHVLYVSHVFNYKYFKFEDNPTVLLRLQSLSDLVVVFVPAIIYENDKPKLIVQPAKEYIAESTLIFECIEVENPLYIGNFY